MTSEYNLVLHGNQKAVIPSARDRAMIEFLWKHRVASFRTLYRMFYRDSGVRTAYNRLYRFRKNGFLDVKIVDGTFCRYWTLDRRGLAFFKQENDLDLQPIGCRPQSYKHDHLASAILLGEWYLQKPPELRLITEQEILASEESILGFSKTDSRRPDGLWQFNCGPTKNTVALEVEFNAKTESEYENIVRAYDNIYAINKIVWVVRGQSLIEKIHRLAVKGSTFKASDHLFLSLEDVQKRLWDAKFKNKSMLDVSLSQFLNSFLGKPFTPLMNSPGNSLVKSHQTHFKEFITSDLLNLTIPLRNSGTYLNTGNLKSD